jgi:ParB-like chromosome segregation protein Spo0J
MALALNNAQGELHPLEEGMHALGSGMTQREYAAKAGKSANGMQRRMQAATVASTCTDISADPREYWSQLTELHPAPRWLWRSLVSRLVSEGWTVEQARKQAQRLKDTEAPPEWTDSASARKRTESASQNNMLRTGSRRGGGAGRAYPRGKLASLDSSSLPRRGGGAGRAYPHHKTIQESFLNYPSQGRWRGP